MSAWWRRLVPWRTRGPSTDVIEARERLEATNQDDARVDRLERRTARILREDNLAPTIMDALGVKRR